MAQEKEKNPSARKKTKRRSPRLSGVSKRRKMANARERRRVHALNTYIENLRELIPLLPCEKRPSKTEVIWMAATYIEFLTELLENSKNPADDKNVPKAAVVNTQEASGCLDADGFADTIGANIFDWNECPSVSGIDLDALLLVTDSEECLKDDNSMFLDKRIDYHLNTFFK